MMRSHLRIAVCAILLTGVYGNPGPSAPPTDTPLNAGDNFYVTILTFTDNVVKCYLETPQGLKVQFKPDDESEEKFQLQPDDEFIKCRALVNNVDKNDVGIWTLRSEADDGNNRMQQYNVTVNPVQDSPGAKYVEYLDEVNIPTVIGLNHVISIPEFQFGETENCYVILPTGQKVGLRLPIVNVDAISNAEGEGCSIKVKVTSDEAVGRWMLISEGTRYSERIEKRLPFRITAEEIVQASVDKVSVVEGNDFYVRLENPISNPDTCRLLGPNETLYENYENDTRYEDTCGFIIRNARPTHTGQWEINYGNRIAYRALIQVLVHGAAVVQASNFTWTKDRPVDVTLGPDGAIYCKIESPRGFMYYDGFGRCKINIDRAIMSEHNGVWKMNVGMPGHVLTQESEINIVVEEAAPKAIVTTRVVEDKPRVSLSCSVSSPHPIRSCKFRDPTGRVLIAAEGVGESRYSWHGTGVSYTSGVHEHDCGIQITDPIVRDLGIWRCAVETEGETYFGFLSVLCPWAMRDPEVAAGVATEPVLRADRDWVTSVGEDSVTMTCSVQAPIRYCYFRSRNGTVFNVGPSDSHDFATYVGAGFDAGDCGVRFPSLTVADSGAWSCHVGFLDPQLPEQRARVDVTVHDSMVVTKAMEGNWLLLEAQVYNRRALDYCRFVRIDGFGFTEENVPINYVDKSNLSQGRCGLLVTEPTLLELHPWTIVARIRGQDVELARVTPHAFDVPDSPGGGGGGGSKVQFHLPGAWILIMSVGMCMVLLAIFVGPMKNRQWTYARASALRNSFVRKAAEQTAEEKAKNTAVAA